MTQDIAASDVIAFWKEAGPEKWFASDPAFDAEFARRFEAAHFAAARRELDGWLETPEGALALMILLDQFPRNAFRGTAHMFATDPLARSLASRIIAGVVDRDVGDVLRGFIYLPFMHSEALADQDRSVALYELLGGPSLPHAIEHHGIIRRFGRFPHRNRLLGRESTPEELSFLESGGFAG